MLSRSVERKHREFLQNTVERVEAFSLTELNTESYEIPNFQVGFTRNVPRYFDLGISGSCKNRRGDGTWEETQASRGCCGRGSA